MAPDLKYKRKSISEEVECQFLSFSLPAEQPIFFRVFQASKGKREAGGERETRVMGKCPEKEYAFHFFFRGFLSRACLVVHARFVSPEKLDKIAGQQASFFSVVRAMEIQLIQEVVHATILKGNMPI